ncbi:MAG: DUF1566 domain-containing protein [Bacteroidaceae bacterium]|nr:DUF1566 domain-containing protein [Bacteroidaceae bacterium]
MEKQEFTVCDVINATKKLNGIYLVYEDGSFMPFSEECKKEGIAYIGIIHDGHPFCVALKDLGEFELVKNWRKCPGESDLYVRSECEALNDWDFIKRTKHIQEVGTDIPLKDGEYIPSLPVLNAMCYWRKRGLNDALVFAGGEPLKDDFYWSSTEYTQYIAWNMHFGSGYIYFNFKYNSYVARAVAAFNLERSE